MAVLKDSEGIGGNDVMRYLGAKETDRHDLHSALTYWNTSEGRKTFCVTPISQKNNMRKAITMVEFRCDGRCEVELHSCIVHRMPNIRHSE